MAAEDNDAVFSNSDDASIALLRRLHAGAAVDFVHHVDVCSAAPADLVADLEAAPGTATDSACWYFYCPKKYKNAQGKACGHRQRAIAGGDTCWHAEGRPKEAARGGGGTACNLSYGRRKEGRSFSRLGWCMTEYDDHHQTDAAGYVLRKVYRSLRAQVKVKPSSSGNSTSSGSKRKAAGGEHPEARPAKFSSHGQAAAFFTHDYAVVVTSTVAQANAEEWIGCPPAEMFRGEKQQQLSTEPTQDGGEFVETPYGPLPSEVAQVNVEEWIGGAEEMFGGGEEGHGLELQTSEQDDGFLADPTAEDLFGLETTTSGMPPAAAAPLQDADFFDGLESFFGVQEEQSMQMHQPRAEPDPLAEFVQSQWMACQQQESQWMTMRRLLQGPPSFLTCP